VLADLWPTYQLRIRTPRLQLRLPDEGELSELADLAGRGVHEPGQRPFLTPWTDGRPEDRVRIVLQSHWADLAGWSAENWSLGLGVFAASGAPLGMVTVRARDFAVVREVATSSWLGLPHHGKGFGTEARLGLLTLGFDHLGAEAAVTEVFQDNHASQGVSRKLGYEPDGISRDARGAEVLVSDRLRLTRSRWESLAHPRAVVDGIPACRHMFDGNL
jgi:RimJ/RimL family protein N-acetyltransferase